MMFGRSLAVALACMVGLALGSCTPFSGYVADHWPHFAGGEPDGLPPRPGDPGYNRFILHGQPAQSTVAPAANAQPPVASAQPPAASATGAIAPPPPAAAAQTPTAFAEPPAADTKPAAQFAPAVARPADDQGVVHGGLY
jgi:hypothetical protein